MSTTKKPQHAKAASAPSRTPTEPPPAPGLALRSATRAQTVLIADDVIVGQLRIEATGLCAVTVESVTLSLTLAHDATPFPPPQPTGAPGEGLNAIVKAVQDRIALLSPLGLSLAVRLGGEAQTPNSSSPTTSIECPAPGRATKTGTVTAAFICRAHPSWLPVLDALDADKLHRHGVFGHIQVVGLVVGAPYPSGTVVDVTDSTVWPKVPVVFRDTGEPVVTGRHTQPRRRTRADMPARASLQRPGNMR